MKTLKKLVDFHKYVKVNPDKDEVTFKIQNGPIKEVGINGCQIDDMIIFARKVIESFNQDFPCHQNAHCITHLRNAEMWLMMRKRDRERRGVEGYDKE